MIIIANADLIYSDYKNGKGVDLSSVGALIADEGHHFTQNSWSSVYAALPNLERSYGFSGTIFGRNERSDSVDFAHFKSIEAASSVACSGPLMISLKAKDIPNYINPVVLVNLVYDWGSAAAKLEGVQSWIRISRATMGNKDRNRFLSNLMKLLGSSNRRAVLPVHEKKHGEILMSGYGHKEAICWYGSGDVRILGGGKTSAEKAHEMVSSGEAKHIICTSHLNEGANFPDLNTIILQDGKKPRTQVQRVGRVARLSDVKSLVINIVDSGVSILEEHSRQRSREIKSYYGVKAYKIESLSDFEEFLKRII
jgi:superfamily II DNA or RNA helicase